MLWNKVSLEQPTVQFVGESKYLNPLLVSGYQHPQDEPCHSASPQSTSTTTTCFELRVESLYLWKIPYKIQAALKILTFREQHVLVQFWSPRAVGKHQLLTTIDQPFGLGVASEELCYFRRDSEHRAFLVDKDHVEEDLSPPARVFRRGLPEWTSDVKNYKSEDFPQQDCAIRCNLQGYLALPVFDSTTRLCVGVLEILTSSKCTSYAYEVEQVHKALQAENLTSPQAFDIPTSKIVSERRQSELDKILDILKFMCDVHSLPLAQTWTVSPPGSYVSHNKVIEKTCSSFNTKCIGKVCMSTVALPFHVRDLSMWHFREACKTQHLYKATGLVGKAFLDRGSCYCQDVTELSEEEYPLVHYARMSRLISCFTIFLHSLEGDENEDYVLEFFLPSKDSRHVLYLVQTLKLRVEVASGFELGEISPLEVSEPPRDVSYISSSIKPHTIQISSTTTANTLMDSSDSESFLANVAKTDSANDPTQCSSKQVRLNKQVRNITDNVSSQKMRQSRKRKIDSLTMETVEQHVGKTLDQTAQILSVSRSTLKRFCREHGISSWPVPKHTQKNILVKNPKLSQELCSEKRVQQSSIGGVVFMVLKIKRWSCSSKNHGFKGRWWICGKHSYLPYKFDSIYQVARLVVLLRRWRCRSLNRRGYQVPRSVHHVLDTRLLTVKASYKNDMIKFILPVSSGLLELEKEVAKRVSVRGQRLNLKYMDEENDWVLITCDADLQSLASKTTIRLLVDAVDGD